ncbi:3-coathanger stack domain-containing protein [Emticicia agri]|uniref:Ig-like domain-containing protein n=1 Tax=Emticicia agri TaxID=2492393 RepID=A0A4Q5LTA2_9BACT|nr:3-coathanger stack domain-containing protein [Emticicia agri]RYU92659.1 hypothetical protein EWM59_26000 [Emticicia agri]
MKRLCLLYLSLGFIFITKYSQAQSVSPKVLSSAGGSVSVGNIQVSRSIGETFIVPGPTNTSSVSRGFQQNTSSISVGTISLVTFCSGDPIDIPFTAIDIFGSGNIFTAELSDASRNFTSPVSLGSLSSNNSGNIQGIIPLNTSAGNGYRIRVRSSSPVVNSLSNATNLTINQTPQASASNTGPYNVGQTIALSASGGTTYSWSGPASFSSSVQSPTIPDALQGNEGIYTVAVSSNGCSATATTQVVINGLDPCVRLVDYYYNKSGNPYQSLFPLVDGMVIDQVSFQTTISLVPVCDTLTIGSFELNMQGPDLNWNIIQNIFPYTVFDNLGNHFYGMNLQPGQYTLTATGYAEDNKGGVRTYGPVIIRFTIVGNLATISSPTLSTTNLCAGTDVDVSFTTTGSFNGGNAFEVQLSNEYGNFEAPAPTIIGTTNTVGVVHCTIPLSVTGGPGYRIRVASSNQTLAGNPTMSTLVINPLNRNLTDNITSGDNLIKVSGELTGSNKLTAPARVAYQAGKAILMNPGFETSGAVFKAEIKGCTD